MSYRNPVTYVDSQSGKYFASAIQNISNTTAGVINKLGIKAEEERKNKEAENLKLLNDTTKYNLDYLNSANLASKDFDLQPSLQPALSGLVDEAAKIKAQLFNSKSPAERSQLQSQLTQYENFFKGGGMKNLLETFQEKREAYSKLGTVGKAGNEGGVDLQKLDPQLSKFFLSTYNDRLPSDLGINIVNNNGVFDIVLNSSGGQFGKNGSYQQSLMGLMSAEIPTIPNITSESNQALYEDNLIDSKTKYVTDKGMATYLRGSGRKNVGSNTFEFYEFDDQGKKLFRENMGRNVLATLAGYSNEGTLMDGPGTGFNSIESYYNNVLRQSGDPDLEIGNEKGTSLTPESLELVTKHMVDNLEKEFEKGINPRVLKKKPSQTSSYETSLGINVVNEVLNIKLTPIQSASAVNVAPEDQGKEVEKIRNSNIEKHKLYLRKKGINAKSKADLVSTLEKMKTLPSPQNQDSDGKVVDDDYIKAFENTAQNLYVYDAENKKQYELPSYDPNSNESLLPILNEYGGYGSKTKEQISTITSNPREKGTSKSVTDLINQYSTNGG